MIQSKFYRQLALASAASVALGVLTASLAGCATASNAPGPKAAKTLSANSQQVWVINTIAAKEGQAEAIAALQLELVEKVKAGWPGFISQQTLVSRDGRTVTTIEVWNDFDTLKAIAESPRLIEYRQRIQQLGTLSPVLYRLAGSTSAN